MADKQYDNTNSGALYKNDRKAAPTHADWSGNLNVNGEEFYLNAWIKEKKADGSKFFSLSIKPKSGAAKAPPKAAAARIDAMLDDNVPF
jgi:hypothetical protein